MEYSTYGRHIVVDLWGCNFNMLNDVVALTGILTEAADKCGAEVLSVQSRKFEPNGVTVLVMLSESHISIHTYPEKGYAGLDCYTCGEIVDPQVAVNYVKTFVKHTHIFSRRFVRGLEVVGILDA